MLNEQQLAALLIKVAVAASIASILMRFGRIQKILLRDERSVGDRVQLAFIFSVLFGASAGVRILSHHTYQAVDLALEGDVAGPGEGRRHGCVTDVGGGPDPRYVLRCEQARTGGKNVVNIAMAPMCRYHSEVGDDRVVTIMCGDHESDRFSVR